jgi:NADH-quinone oxidoreductase subunit F
MDLRLIPGAAASAEEREAVDRAVGAGGRRDLLLPALHALQAAAGWITPGGLNYACERLHVPPAEAFGVASFYKLLSTEPRPKRVVHVCDDLACRERGDALCADLARRGESVHRSPCLGHCERAPAALVQSGGREWTAAPAGGAIDTPAGPPLVPQAEGLRLLRRVNRVDPESLEAYRASGGYEALAKARAIGPEAVIREVVASKLAGRGGASFPTGRKWEAVARQPARPHWFALNADESEPGTFKDRVLMEGDPFAVVEGATIAGLATGCERGFVYVRGEYPRAFERLEGAMAQARRAGLLGGAVGFDLELRRGAGAYICGEETALFNSIEGYRGEPRQKPPFPVEAGLFGKPTAINNVETVVNVLDVVLGGGAAFPEVETRLFSVSGALARPGLYELRTGTTLRELLAQAGAGTLEAVLLGGAAGTFLAPAEFDIPLTLEGTRAIGAGLGSGVVMAFAPGTDWPAVLLRIAAFFRDESCGQCVPCRVGTLRQEEALLRSEHGLLGEIGQVMRDASICGLGQTASSAVLSALRKLPVRR